MKLSQDELRAMLEKAEQILSAIENKEWNLLDDALNIPCEFCTHYLHRMEYMNSKTPQDLCGGCPMYEAGLCNWLEWYDSPYRRVDNLAYHPDRKQDEERIAEAVHAAEELLAGVKQMLEEAYE